ncbi:MAG: hypothetical protein LBG52_03700, partial [Candidatus Peribacteria bacterium]|nr:hypothetical protein [Candidatus Peribacteria bacterium]
MSVYKIRKLLDTVENTDKSVIVPEQKEVVVTMDTTYFGRTYGIMVFRSESLRKNLHWKTVKYETKELYQEGIRELER